MEIISICFQGVGSQRDNFQPLKSDTIRTSGLILAFILLKIGLLSACGMPPLADEPAGITFFRGSWKEVLAEAKRQNKPIFLDIYTTWCPPCKRMAAEAFPNPKIGAKFNVHFINYQLDAEKGEGIQLAKQYAVASYPTALYIAPNGALVHRAVGYAGINGMIDQADHILALPQLRTTLAKGDKAYADGKRDPTFLKKYIETRQTLNRPINDVLDAYINALAAWERPTARTITFVAETIQSSNTKAFDYLIKNRPALAPSDSLNSNLNMIVSNALSRVLTTDFMQVIATSNEVLLETIIANSERKIASENPLLIRDEKQKQEAANLYRLKFLQQTQTPTK